MRSWLHYRRASHHARGSVHPMKTFRLLSTVAVLSIFGFSLFYTLNNREPKAAAASEATPLMLGDGDESERKVIADSSMPMPLAVRGAKPKGVYQDPGAVTAKENQTPPPGPALAVIRSLTPQAEQGDARAALQIFQKLEQCQGALKTNLRDGGLSDQATNGGDRVYALKQIEAVLQECQGLEDKDLASMGYWVEKAAKGGNLLAMLRYSDGGYRYLVGDETEMLRNPERVIEYKKKSVEYLHQAASKGVPEAMLSLATTYKLGIMAEADPVQAYAYAKAAQMVHPSGPPGGQAQFLTIYSDGLSPDHLTQGNALARAVYDKCCLK